MAKRSKRSKKDGPPRPKEKKQPPRGKKHVGTVEASAASMRLNEVLTLALLSLYSKTAPSREGKETSVGFMPFLVLIFETIVAGVIDFDYAPECVAINAGNHTCVAMWLNVSKQALQGLSNLKALEFVTSVTPTRSDNVIDGQYAGNVSITARGEQALRTLPRSIIEQIRNVLSRPSPAGGRMMFSVVFKPSEKAFLLRTADGFERRSLVSQMELLPFLARPYLPPSLLPRALSRFRGAEGAAAKLRQEALLENAAAMTRRTDSMTMGDPDVMQSVTLSGVVVLFSEWLPLDTSQVSYLREFDTELQRSKVGVFMEQAGVQARASFRADFADDLRPTVYYSLLHAQGHSNVSLYASIESVLPQLFIQYAGHLSRSGYDEKTNKPKHPKSACGFGVSVQSNGVVVSSFSLTQLLDKDANFRLGLLSRVISTSQLQHVQAMENLMALAQRELIATAVDDISAYKRYVVVTAHEMSPLLDSIRFCDGSDNEADVTQIVGDVQRADNLWDSHAIIIGRYGLLLVGEHASEYHSVLAPYALYFSIHGLMRVINGQRLTVMREFRSLLDLETPQSKLPFVVSLDEKAQCLIRLIAAMKPVASNFSVGPEPWDDNSAAIANIFQLRAKADGLILRVDECHRSLTRMVAQFESVCADLKTRSRSMLKIHATISDRNIRRLIDFQRTSNQKYINLIRRNTWLFAAHLALHIGDALVLKQRGFRFASVPARGLPFVESYSKLTHDFTYFSAASYLLFSVIVAALTSWLIAMTTSTRIRTMSVILNPDISLPAKLRSIAMAYGGCSASVDHGTGVTELIVESSSKSSPMTPSICGCSLARNSYDVQASSSRTRIHNVWRGKDENAHGGHSVEALLNFIQKHPI